MNTELIVKSKKSRSPLNPNVPQPPSPAHFLQESKHFGPYPTQTSFCVYT